MVSYSIKKARNPASGPNANRKNTSNETRMPRRSPKNRVSPVQKRSVRSASNRSPKSKRSSNVPEKYLAGLSPRERAKRTREITARKKLPSSGNSKAYAPFETDRDPKTGAPRKTKTSTYTETLREYYPNVSTLAEKSEASGVPEDVLQRVYDKGLAAWRTGHRPGATQGQWANARVASFLVKGCTHYSPDHLLVAEAKKRSPKASKLWQNMPCRCHKGCK